MRRRTLPPETPVDGFDMTPMIDIVFQLIIFFMLVNDMASAQREPVALPTASQAVKERVEDPSVLVLNVMKDGTIRAGGRPLWTPALGDDCRKLEELFEARRQSRAYQETPGRTEWVKYPVLVRADRSAPFEHLQKILMIAARHGGVTRVQLGARQEAK